MSKQGKQGTLQNDIYNLIKQENGLRVVDIAQSMKVTMNCVKGHLANLIAKGSVYSRPPAAGYAHRYHACLTYDHLWISRPDDANRWERYY